MQALWIENRTRSKFGLRQCTQTGNPVIGAALDTISRPRHGGRAAIPNHVSGRDAGARLPRRPLRVAPTARCGAGSLCSCASGTDGGALHHGWIARDMRCRTCESALADTFTRALTDFSQSSGRVALWLYLLLLNVGPSSPRYNWGDSWLAHAPCCTYSKSTASPLIASRALQGNSKIYWLAPLQATRAHAHARSSAQ